MCTSYLKIKNGKGIINMKKQILPEAPQVKNWEMMSIVNNLMYYKEQLKVETDTEKRGTYQKRFDELRVELENCKVVNKIF
jgi:hypothetical protein